MLDFKISTSTLVLKPPSRNLFLHSHLPLDQASLCNAITQCLTFTGAGSVGEYVRVHCNILTYIMLMSTDCVFAN